MSSAIRSTRLAQLLVLSGYTNVEKRGTSFLRKSIDLFNEALERDPALIEAHFGLAHAYALLPSYDDSDVEIMFANARAELELAVEAGAEVERTYAIEAFMHLRRMEWVKGEERFRQAIAYDPTDANLRQCYSQFLAKVGFLTDASEQASAALELDDGSPVMIQRLGVAYVFVGENLKAEDQFAAAVEAGIAPFTNPEPKIILKARQGKYEEVAHLLRAVQESQGLSSDWIPSFISSLDGGTDEARRRALMSAADAWHSGELSPRFYFGVSLLMNAPESGLAVTNELLRDGGFTAVVEGLFLPEAKEMRAEPAFFTLVEEVGLDSYWARYGVPDMCDGELAEPFCARIPRPDIEPEASL